MRPVVLLAELNQIDLVVDARTARLAEIELSLKEPAILLSIRRDLAQAEAELKQLQAQHLEREKVQRDSAARLAATRTKLYGGTVRVPKELEDLEAGVQQARRQMTQAEDVLLETMIALDAAGEKCASLGLALEHEGERWNLARTVLLDEKARLVEKLRADQARLARALQALPAQYLPTYDALKSRRGGRAIAMLEGNVCNACGVEASPTKVEAARYGSELLYCDNCGRLLWGE